ncbi:MAG: hypothetical protein LBH98_06240 [Chitinispirillales bacterium]|jgi:hypothetical protein|nr:hypothetical protein [Chitinispirillales bacterium]
MKKVFLILLALFASSIIGDVVKPQAQIYPADKYRENDGVKLCLVAEYGLYGDASPYGRRRASKKAQKLNKKNPNHYYFVDDVDSVAVSYFNTDFDRIVHRMDYICKVREYKKCE